ncbi:MAG: MarR family transcriptional regulator [Phycisphaerales bacterium]|nr:MarR family transcriptional regulator [Phycisphaerales bacterium]
MSRAAPSNPSSASPAPGSAPGGEARCAQCDESPLALEIFTIRNLMMKVGDRLVAPLGLTSGRWMLLSVLSERDDAPTMSEVGEHVLMSVQNVSRMVAAMESDGLVRRTTRPGSGRATFIELTDHGRAIHQRSIDAAAAFSRRFLAGFTPDEVAVLQDGLGRLIRNLDLMTDDSWSELHTSWANDPELPRTERKPST